MRTRLTSDFEETQCRSRSLVSRDSGASYQVYSIRTLKNSKFQASITVAFLCVRKIACEYRRWYSSEEQENLGFSRGLSNFATTSTQGNGACLLIL